MEEGSAAVAEPSRPGKKEAANAFNAVATEEAAAVGGNSDAAAEDGAEIESCMFMKNKILAANANPQLRPTPSKGFRLAQRLCNVLDI